MQQIQRLSTQQRHAQLVPKYRQLIRVSRQVVANARQVLKQTQNACGKTPLEDLAIQALRKEIEHYCQLGDRVIDQARRRVLDGEQVPTDQKIYSIFESHTDLTTSRFAAAEAAFRLAIQLRPAFVPAHANLALTLEEIGRPEETERIYLRAIELADEQNLKDSQPYMNFGRYLARRNQTARSLLLLKRAFALSPASGEACYWLGKVLYAEGKDTDAVVTLKQCADLDPKLPDVYYLLSRIHLKRGELDAAKKETVIFEALRSSQAKEKAVTQSR